MGDRDPLRSPSMIYVPKSCKCPLTDCEQRARSTLCYIREDYKTCDLYESEVMVDDFLTKFRENEGGFFYED